MKILVLNFEKLEDIVLATPVVNSLKKTFPKSEIDFVVFEEYGEVLKNHKFINKIIEIPKEETTFLHIFRVRKILKTKYDIIIDLTSTRKSGWFTFLSFGTKYKIRYEKDKIFNWGCSYLVPKSKMYVDKVSKNLEFLEPLKKIENTKIIYTRDITLDITNEKKKEIKELMKKKGIDVSVPIFACSLFGYKKHYSIEKLIEIMNSLAKEIKCNIVIYHSQKRKFFTGEAYKKIENKKQIHLLELNSIEDYKGFFANCKFIFGNDCQERYISQGMEVKSFTLFLDNNNWIENYGDKYQGIVSSNISEEYSGYTKDKIYGNITTEFVVNKIKEMLK